MFWVIWTLAFEVALILYSIPCMKLLKVAISQQKQKGGKALSREDKLIIAIAPGAILLTTACVLGIVKIVVEACKIWM